MGRRGSILILEDSDSRIASFQSAVRALGPDWTLHLWHEAPTMIAQCGDLLADAALISLDHDLLPRAGAPADIDPGDGLAVAMHLSKLKPSCPVIIHTSNAVRRQRMLRELLCSCWKVETVVPGATDWIEQLWTARLRSLVKWREIPSQ